MPGWLLPVIKSVLPYVGTIVSAAAPVFTNKSSDTSTNQTALLQQQITELQAAASANDAHIKELAVQLQNTVAALERGATVLVFAILALIISVFALATAMYRLLA